MNISISQVWMDKNTICKPILDYPVNVKPCLCKESNKQNIFQKLEVFFTYKLDQKLSSVLATKKLITKATLEDR